ncbi:MAG: hypothetical protein ACRD03_08090, partial [Acidimicrobiales bacterium]
TVAGLRVAVAESLPGATTGTRMRGVVADVATRLSTAGAQLDQRLPGIDWETSNELFVRLLGVVTGIFAPGSELDEEQRSLGWYLAALDRRDDVVAAWEVFFEDVDVLLLPPAMAPAFPHVDPYAAIDVDGRDVGYLAHGGVLTFANLRLERQGPGARRRVLALMNWGERHYSAPGGSPRLSQHRV